MAKQYGLILSNNDKTIRRPSIFDEDSDSDTTSEKPTGLRKAHKKQEKITRDKAMEEDPTVYQYDEIYDEIEKKRKESKLSRKDLDRKPKYINRLLAAAERRKKENERRIERQVQKERETEGDVFKDKEAFVTSAYKRKLEELKKMEEREMHEEYLEAIGDVRKQGNLDGFYRHLYDQKVNYKENNSSNDETNIELKTKTSEDNSNEQKKIKRKYRKRENSEESENKDDIEIELQHLPSHLDADSDFSIDSSDSADEKEDTVKKKDEELSENVEIKLESEIVNETSKLIGKKSLETNHNKKSKVDIWKKRTVGEVFDAALQRYYQRKTLREL